MNGEWFPGPREPIIAPELFAAAHRGRARGTDLLSGPVRRRLCHRLIAFDQKGEGHKLYRCHHRGQGCDQPRRTNTALHRAAVLAAAHRRLRAAASGHPPAARAGIERTWSVATEVERRVLIDEFMEDISV